MGVYLRGKSWFFNFYEEGKRYTERVGQVSKTVSDLLPEALSCHVG
jgi:hypothetical protein